jgi:hypothetical protein
MTTAKDELLVQDPLFLAPPPPPKPERKRWRPWHYAVIAIAAPVLLWLFGLVRQRVRPAIRR